MRRQIAAQAQKPTGTNRQTGNGRFPVVHRKLSYRQSGSGDFGLVIRQMQRQFGVAKAQSRFADHRSPIGHWNRFTQGREAQPCSGQHRFVACRTSRTEQVEQLPILCTRRTFAGCAMAQHCCEAVVDLHCCTLLSAVGQY